MAQLQQQSALASPIFNISREGFQELQKAGLTLDQLFYLETVKFGVDIKDTISKDKYLTWRQSLIRKGYLTETAELSEDGNLVLQAVGSGEPFKGAIEKRSEATEEAFEEWWKAYPSCDIFTYKGRKFDGTRSFRKDKIQCKDKFIKIVNEGQYTAKDLIQVLEFEVTLKKEASMKKGTNELKYLVNTHSYLNQRLFEGLMEASKGEKAPSQTFEDL